MRILLVEDDFEIAQYIQKGLKEHYWTVEHVENGQQALEYAISQSFDMLIVDRMLPGLDGLTVVKRLRALEISVPILFLSALSDVDERVKGLRAGGDDYLVKPFSFSELLARIDVLLRRTYELGAAASNILILDSLSINLLTRKATREGRVIELNNKEFNILVYLVKNKSRVISRTMLLEQIWGYHFDTGTNVIDVHISNIRKKVDGGSSRPLLHTVRGSGYKADTQF